MVEIRGLREFLNSLVNIVLYGIGFFVVVPMLIFLISLPFAIVFRKIFLPFSDIIFIALSILIYFLHIYRKWKNPKPFKLKEFESIKDRIFNEISFLACLFV